MPPGTPHIVITIGMTMFAGNHFYLWHSMSDTIFSIYDTVILGNLTNDENDNSWEVLRRMGLDLVNQLEARLSFGESFADPDREAACTAISSTLFHFLTPPFMLDCRDYPRPEEPHELETILHYIGFIEFMVAIQPTFNFYSDIALDGQ
jgi:hypothetical protein